MIPTLYVRPAVVDAGRDRASVRVRADECITRSGEGSLSPGSIGGETHHVC